MTSTSIIVRPVATPGELMLLLRLADQAFSDEPSESGARDWQQFLTAGPEYRSEEIRGAFRAGEQAGGYIIYECELRMGAARLTTGCISAVVTHPHFRHQGVASALMQDAINYAQTHKHALLLLDGIPKFYHRYGYTHVFDLSIQLINREGILAQRASAYSVRPATVDDARAILSLYERQYSPYSGSFTRSLERQAHLLRHHTAQNPPFLALNASGQPQGYLTLSRGEEHPQALEMAAENWSAALALLQYHARLVEGSGAPSALRYRLPPTAPVLQWMIDTLEVPDTTMWRHPADEWGVLSQTFHHRYTGWMARLVDLAVLARELLPEWQARWRRSLAHWSGTLSLLIDDETCTFHIDGSELHLHAGPEQPAASIRLTAQAFMQLVFGYRSISQLLGEEIQAIGTAVRSVLDILFPLGHTWIPSSDMF
jgi:predicted N-acetyltransferase YhbS